MTTIIVKDHRLFNNVVMFFFKDIFNLDAPLDVTSTNFSIYFGWYTLLLQHVSDIDELGIFRRCFKTSNCSIKFNDSRNRWIKDSRISFEGCWVKYKQGYLWVIFYSEIICFASSLRNVYVNKNWDISVRVLRIVWNVKECDFYYDSNSWTA